jgi:hypothetical protein
VRTDKLNIMNTVEYLKMEGREEGFQIGFAEGIEEDKAFFVENLLTKVSALSFPCGFSPSNH